MQLANVTAGAITDIAAMLNDVGRDVTARLGTGSVILVALEGMQTRLQRQAGFVKLVGETMLDREKRHNQRVLEEIDRRSVAINAKVALESSVDTLTHERDALKRQVRTLLGKLGNSRQRLAKAEAKQRRR